MKDSTRKCIAYLALKMVVNSRRSSVYDDTNESYYNFSGNITPSSIDVYDYDQSCHVSGNSIGVHKFSLYDMGNSGCINFEVNGNEIRGYDYDSGYQYSGRINGNNISMYDYENGSYYDYSI